MPEMTSTQITDDMINAGLREWWRDRLAYNTSCGWECMRRTLAAALAAAPVAVASEPLGDGADVPTPERRQRSRARTGP
jgi:hypothetical protein